MDDVDERGIPTTLKARKEAFVTGHGGSDTPWEVLWVSTALLWGTWLYLELAVLGIPVHPLVLEFLLVGLPAILAQTDYLYPYGTSLMVGELVLALFLCFATGEFIKAVTLCVKRITKQMPREASTPAESTTNEDDANDPTPPSSSASPPQPNSKSSLAYLTLYRSTIYALTFVAILAVDFTVFPRRFCKTEIAGYGLMDVGAASFCVSGGIVAGKAYCAKQRTDETNAGLFRSLTRPLCKAAPLIFIGIVRTVTNKELDYQEHVSEYGVHWNFFFTLGVLAVLAPVRQQLILSQKVPEMIQRWAAWAPLALMVLYQYELDATRHDPNGLQSFILTAPRRPPPLAAEAGDASSTIQDLVVQSYLRPFFFANREGILGCIGYWFLHAAGEYVGKHYVFGDPAKLFPHSPWSLGTISVLAWLLHLLLAGLSKTSRRTTNLSFCVWAIAHNLTILWGCKVVCQWSTKTNSPRLPRALAAVNRHGMASFLVANVLTGLTNLLVPTIDTGDAAALAILAAYLAAVGGVALLLDKIQRTQRRTAKAKTE